MTIVNKEFTEAVLSQDCRNRILGAIIQGVSANDSKAVADSLTALVEECPFDQEILTPVLQTLEWLGKADPLRALDAASYIRTFDLSFENELLERMVVILGHKKLDPAAGLYIAEDVLHYALTTNKRTRSDLPQRAQQCWENLLDRLSAQDRCGALFYALDAGIHESHTDKFYRMAMRKAYSLYSDLAAKDASARLSQTQMRHIATKILREDRYDRKFMGLERFEDLEKRSPAAALRAARRWGLTIQSGAEGAYSFAVMSRLLSQLADDGQQREARSIALSTQRWLSMGTFFDKLTDLATALHQAKKKTRSLSPQQFMRRLALA